jgi:hypothetical protein
LAYGDIYSVDHIETKDPFQAHRPTCGTCAQSPAHVLVNAWRKKPKVSLDSFAKMGGWIQVSDEYLRSEGWSLTGNVVYAMHGSSTLEMSSSERPDRDFASCTAA